MVVCNLLSVFIEVQSLAENSGDTKMKKIPVSVSTSAEMTGALGDLRGSSTISFILCFKFYMVRQ